MLLLFSLFHLICFLKTGCFFHVICFLRTGCFFHVICFIKTGCFICCLFWLLSILCFVVKNDLRQKIYFRFFSEVQYAASEVTFFSPFFASHVSSKLVVFSRQMLPQSLFFFHVICFIKTGWFKCLVFGWFCCETMSSLLTKLANLRKVANLLLLISEKSANLVVLIQLSD